MTTFFEETVREEKPAWKMKMEEDAKWEEFYSDFFQEDFPKENDWNDELKAKYRNRRRTKRKAKKHMLELFFKTYCKHRSKYRWGGNGKKYCPSKPIIHRERKFSVYDIE